MFMKNLLLNRIPSICICFTIVILAGILCNWIFGEAQSVYPLFLFGWLTICQGIDWLISRIDFRNWMAYCLTESIVLYIVSFAAGLGLKWMNFTWDSVIAFTVIFLVVDGFIFWYFRRRQEILAEEINELIKKRDISE